LEGRLDNCTIEELMLVHQEFSALTENVADLIKVKVLDMKRQVTNADKLLSDYVRKNELLRKEVRDLQADRTEIVNHNKDLMVAKNRAMDEERAAKEVILQLADELQDLRKARA
jgi:phage terminase small subunit